MKITDRQATRGEKLPTHCWFRTGCRILRPRTSKTAIPKRGKSLILILGSGDTISKGLLIQNQVVAKSNVSELASKETIIAVKSKSGVENEFVLLLASKIPVDPSNLSDWHIPYSHGQSRLQFPPPAFWRNLRVSVKADGKTIDRP